MLTVFGAAFGLGFVFNAAPGPVFAETIRRGVRSGFRPALAVQVGSLAGDAVWAVIGLAGVGLLLQLEPLRVPISLAGVAYLLWLAWDSWRASTREFAVDTPADRSHSRQALRSGVLLSLTNPQNVAYWAAMGSALGGLGLHEPRVFDSTLFFAGFMLSSVVWAFLLAALVDRVLGRAGVRWAQVTHRVCAIAFLALALSSLRAVWVSLQSSSPNHAPSAIAREP